MGEADLQVEANEQMALALGKPLEIERRSQNVSDDWDDYDDGLPEFAEPELPDAETDDFEEGEFEHETPNAAAAIKARILEFVVDKEWKIEPANAEQVKKINMAWVILVPDADTRHAVRETCSTTKAAPTPWRNRQPAHMVRNAARCRRNACANRASNCGRKRWRPSCFHQSLEMRKKPPPPAREPGDGAAGNTHKEGIMDAPTTQAEIKAAYKELYRTTANAMAAQRDANAARVAVKAAEAVLTTSGATDAGKNAEARAAILFGLTGAERAELSRAEDALAAAECEQALAKIAVNELRELLRLAEWDNTSYYRED